MQLLHSGVPTRDDVRNLVTESDSIWKPDVHGLSNQSAESSSYFKGRDEDTSGNWQRSSQDAEEESHEDVDCQVDKDRSVRSDPVLDMRPLFHSHVLWISAPGVVGKQDMDLLVSANVGSLKLSSEGWKTQSGDEPGYDKRIHEPVCCKKADSFLLALIHSTYLLWSKT